MSPDAGFVTKARKFVKRLRAPMAIAKERIDHTEYAASVHAAVTHGVFTEQSMKALDDAPIKRLLVTKHGGSARLRGVPKGRGRLGWTTLWRGFPDPSTREHQRVVLRGRSRQQRHSGVLAPRSVADIR
jgi:hypothetical protein